MTDKDNKNPQPYIPEWQRLGIKLPTVRNEVLHSNRAMPSTIPPLPKLDNFTLPDTYSSIDGEIIEEEADNIIPVQPVSSGTIDNNDFVDMGVFNSPISNRPTNVQVIPKMADQSEEYILLVRGKVILTGTKAVVEKTIHSILYGEHQDYVDVEMKDLILLKKVKIKAGIFIEED